MWCVAEALFFAKLQQSRRRQLHQIEFCRNFLHHAKEGMQDSESLLLEIQDAHREQQQVDTHIDRIASTVDDPESGHGVGKFAEQGFLTRMEQVIGMNNVTGAANSGSGEDVNCLQQQHNQKHRQQSNTLMLQQIDQKATASKEFNSMAYLLST